MPKLKEKERKKGSKKERKKERKKRELGVVNVESNVEQSHFTKKQT